MPLRWYIYYSVDERNFPGYFIPPISLGFSVGSSSHVEHNHSRLGAHTKRKLHAMREQYVCTAQCTHTHTPTQLNARNMNLIMRCCVCWSNAHTRFFYYIPCACNWIGSHWSQFIDSRQMHADNSLVQFDWLKVAAWIPLLSAASKCDDCYLFIWCSPEAFVFISDNIS